MVIYATIIGKKEWGELPPRGYPYRIGLNTLMGETFNADPKCEDGGLYCCEIKNVPEWLNYGNTLCIVEPVGQIVAVKRGLKTDRLEIMEMMDLRRRETWEFLVDQGVDIHVGSEFALYCAALGGHIEVVKFLVEHGANVNENDPLRMAGGNGHLEIVKLLVDHGADIHMCDDYALRWAAQRGHLEVVKFLVEKGANIYARHGTLLQKVAKEGHLEVAKFLVEKGADVHANDNNALQCVAENGVF